MRSMFVVGSRFTVTFPLSVLLLAALVSNASAQRPGAAQPSVQRGGQGIPISAESPVTLIVSVRENSGMPLQTSAFVKLSSIVGSLHVTSATQDAGTATFPDVSAGDYEIEVTAPQYKTATEHASVMGSGISYTVYVYMQPDSGVAGSNIPSGAPIMTPRLQSEIDKGLDKMRRQQYGAAREHFEKAAKMAPANPDIQYLLGMLEYKQNHLTAAHAKFEVALSIFSTHERSLVALGELLLREGHPDLAAQSLEKAYQVNGADWRMHFLLAHAYRAQAQYEKAATHASRAAELAKEHGAPAQLLLGQILADQGKKAEASRAFDSALTHFPSDPAAAEAKAELAKLENRAVLITTQPTSNASRINEPAAPSIHALPLFVRPWAPADIDAKEYTVAPDVACPQDDVIHRTELRTMKQLANFERFMATEHIEHQEVDANGTPGPVKAHDFSYLVFIQRVKNGSFFLEESRDGGESLDAFPTSLASTGLVSLGAALFDPTYEGDLIYKCEGLGNYRGMAAWQIRFEQRAGVKSQLRTWRNRHGLFFIPLKGRVWVEANTYDVVHIETDLREPQQDLELSRDHLVIDYGPVQFESSKVSLWLPWYAEMFMELRGKRYHHRHTLTNYALFSVDTTNTISAPKQKPQTDSAQNESNSPNP